MNIPCDSVSNYENTELTYFNEITESPQSYKLSKKITAGSKDIKISNKPHGGFPPLFICSNKKSTLDLTKNSNSINTNVNILDVIKEKKNIKPFFSF
tara:strand:- start:508 stop:798 length:291 start_codon:yes stop_codon:yes gene_type:complete